MDLLASPRLPGESRTVCPLSRSQAHTSSYPIFSRKRAVRFRPGLRGGGGRLRFGGCAQPGVTLVESAIDMMIGYSRGGGLLLSVEQLVNDRPAETEKGREIANCFPIVPSVIPSQNRSLETSS
jgi:hypothetical protein